VRGYVKGMMVIPVITIVNRYIIKPFVKTEKSPSVRRLIGKLIKFRIGFITRNMNVRPAPPMR
jgi:hypothetical protein